MGGTLTFFLSQTMGNGRSREKKKH